MRNNTEHQPLNYRDASKQQHERRRILVVDDDRATRELLVRILAKDYDVASAESGPEALAVAEHFTADLALLDIVMPGMDGHQLCRHLKVGRFGSDLQIIMVTAQTGAEDYLDAFKSGADAYVPKPVDHDALRSKVRLHLQLRDTRIEITADDWRSRPYESAFERQVAGQARKLLNNGDANLCTLEILANSQEADDGERLVRIRFISLLLAAELSRTPLYSKQIGVRTVKDLYRSIPLHDLGKIGISGDLLSKDAPFTADETELMRLHTTIGGVLLEQALHNSRNGNYLAMAAVLARCHHERFDGTGYPVGLVGEDIPLPARIVALAHVYDALTTDAGHSPEEVKSRIHEESGRHFDPAVVAAFESRFGDIVRVQKQLDAAVLVGAMAFLE